MFVFLDFIVLRYHCKVLVVSGNPEGRATAPLAILRRRDAEHLGNLGHRHIRVLTQKLGGPFQSHSLQDGYLPKSWQKAG